MPTKVVRSSFAAVTTLGPRGRGRTLSDWAHLRATRLDAGGPYQKEALMLTGAPTPQSIVNEACYVPYVAPPG